jgi:tRNA (guanine-N7-)-methyltransferase
MPEPRLPLDLAPYTVDLAGRESPVSWPELFGNDRPVELEVGSGKGLFLVNAGIRTPLRNFLGIELSRKYAGQAAARVAKRALPNVKVLRGDARAVLAGSIPAASLRAVHIYFPDPWWKKRHKKRRVFTEPFVVAVERALEPGGDFRMATDVEEYFGVMLELMAQHPRFVAQPPPVPSTPEHDLDYLTNFERKYRIQGRPIFRAHFRLG